jgi:hypothetical protein
VIKQLLLPVLVSLGVSTILFFCWLIILKSSLKAGISTILLLLIFWNYGIIHAGVSKLVTIQHLRLIPLLLFIYFHLVYFISKIKQHKTLTNINTILFLPILLLVLINVVTIIPNEITKANIKKSSKSNFPTEKKISGLPSPDIYFIILDEYASLSTIKDEWGYDNSEFADYLREKGFFVVEKSGVRYNQTTWNISTILNLDYLTGPVDQNTFSTFIYNPEKISGSEEYKMLSKTPVSEIIQRINNSFLLNFLKEQNYKLVVLEGISQHYSSFKIEKADVYFGYQDLNNSGNDRFLIDAFTLELIKKSMLFPFNMFFAIDQTYDNNYAGTKYVFNYLNNKIQQIEGPKFVYAHILCPHVPYVFDRAGSYVSPITAGDEMDGKFVREKNTVNAAYLDQYVFVTNQVKELVDNIIQNKPSIDPVIIIQSDHGPRPHLEYLKDRSNSFKVFNTVYFPDGDYRNMYDSIAPVNTMRVIFNKYFGGSYTMLEDR